MNRRRMLVEGLVVDILATRRATIMREVKATRKATGETSGRDERERTAEAYGAVRQGKVTDKDAVTEGGHSSWNFCYSIRATVVYSSFSQKCVAQGGG